jgi:hypothetical protein
VYGENLAYKDKYNCSISRREPDLSPAEQAELSELRSLVREAQPIEAPPEPGSLEQRICTFLQERLP